MRIDRVDPVPLRLEKGFHDFLALGTGELARLALDDLHFGMAVDDLMKAALAVDGRGRPRSPLQFDHVALASQYFRHPTARHASSSIKSEAIRVV